MKDSLIKVKNLGLSFNNKQILKNINFEAQKGEFIGLIGPNGAGKTTLLKCINGIYKSQGLIEVYGKDITSLSEKNVAKNIALMHQNTIVNFPFNGLEVVLMGRYPHLKRMQKESKKDVEIAKGNMIYTDTIKFEEQKVSEMSGGERQRLLFAKALTQETDILLLDEPTASLDLTYQEQIFKYSRELCDSGKIVIAAVHDLKIAARYCSRLILMKNGEIIANGDCDSVITSSNISKAYGVNACVYRNNLTGLLDFYIPEGGGERKGTKVHITGGGGVGSWVIRYLFEKGYDLKSGILFTGDTDLNTAEIFGIDFINCNAFSDISKEQFEENVESVKSADVCVLCNILFGNQNIKNLEALQYAKKLIIIEDDNIKFRDYTEGKAEQLYNELKKKALVTNSSKLHELL